jgi:catechol 2,3-dioxygenase-like lactoylglutathione lyase family enzyme
MLKMKPAGNLADFVRRSFVRDCLGAKSMRSAVPGFCPSTKLSSGETMKHFNAISLLVALGASGLLVGQPKPAAADGHVVSVIQWLTVVADLPKAEQFYHDTMGLESVGGDPRMRLEFYATVPFLMEMYNNKSDLRNFTLRIPGSDMGVEPAQWRDVTGKLLPSRIQDPGAGYLILKTWNINGFMSRIAKGAAQVLTLGGHPVTVAGLGGMNQVLWMREPNGFFVALEQPVPPPPAPGANGAPSPSYYTGADAGFAVEDLDKTVHFYQDLLGFKADTSDWVAGRDQLNAYGIRSGQYRTSTLHLPDANVAIRLIEFKGVERKPLQKKITDPNSLVLRMRVQGIDSLAAKLKAAGTRIVSESGEPYTNGRTRWFMVEGPDNVFVQLTEAPPGAPNPGAPALPR